ncbi:MAG: TRAP transporter small permease [Deltaproteobacteria bacterium]|nr:TRAP transporter small permease [Deltaproteobacteria bacterium]
MSKLMDRLFLAINVFCAVAVFSMMALIVTDITLRTLRLGSIPSGIEIIELSVVLIVFLPLAALQQKKGHIRVEIIHAHLPHRIRLFADFFSWLLFLLFFVIVLWKGLSMLSTSWAVKERMINSPIPVYPVRFCLALGSFFMVIQLIFDLKSIIWKLIEKSTDN